MYMYTQQKSEFHREQNIFVMLSIKKSSKLLIRECILSHAMYWNIKNSRYGSEHTVSSCQLIKDWTIRNPPPPPPPTTSATKPVPEPIRGGGGGTRGPIGAKGDTVTLGNVCVWGGGGIGGILGSSNMHWGDFFCSRWHFYPLTATEENPWLCYFYAEQLTWTGLYLNW